MVAYAPNLRGNTATAGKFGQNLTTASNYGYALFRALPLSETRSSISFA